MVATVATPVESNLVKHARRELEIAGMFDSDADYGGAIGDAVMELIQVLSDQQHSGFSHALTMEIFDKVARFDTLTPIGTTQAEWIEVADNLWQNARQSSTFSEDGGVTWYDIEDESRNNGATWKK